MTAFSKPQKKFKTWSKKWHNLRFACWNCWSYRNERHFFCKNLGYDVLALTELHNMQNNPNFNSKLWIPSTQAKVDEQGKRLDPAAGVVILLSRKMSRHIDKSGCVGPRIAWVRPTKRACMSNVFYCGVHTPQI